MGVSLTRLPPSTRPVPVIVRRIGMPSAATARVTIGNSTGQLGDGTQTNRVSPVKVPGLTGAFGLGGGVNYSVVLG